MTILNLYPNARYRIVGAFSNGYSVGLLRKQLRNFGFRKTRRVPDWGGGVKLTNKLILHDEEIRGLEL